MCEERWQGEDDGTALICDGTAVLPVRMFKLDTPADVLAEAASILRRRGESLLRRRTRQPFVWREEACDGQSQTEDESRKKDEGRKGDA